MAVPANREIVRGLSVTLFFLGSVFLGGWLLTKIYPVLIYFAIGGALSIVGRPIVDFLTDKRIGNRTLPRWLCALITVGVFYLVVLGLFALFIPLIISQADSLAQIDLQELIDGLQIPLERLENFLVSIGVPRGEASRELENLYGSVFREVPFPAIFNGTLGFISNLFVAVFTITFCTFFLLKEEGLFTRVILAFIPERHEGRVKRVMKSSRSLLRGYLVGLAGQLFVFALAVSIGLSVLRVDYAIFIAVIAGILNIIPYLGPMIGGAFGILLAILGHTEYDFSTEMLPLILKVIGVFWLAQMLDNYFVQPTIFANVVKAHPLEIFLVVLAAGLLAGIPGMIVAIPVYTFLRIIAREFLGEFKLVRTLTADMHEEPGRRS